jgi:hypothetical protein
MEYQNLKLKYSDTGFLRNVYQSKDNKRWYVLQWDNGYNNKPVFYIASKDGEPESTIRQDCIEFFIFPVGHEHYGEMLKEQNKKGDSMEESPKRKEFLFDVFIIALEGGIGYWAYVEGYNNNPENYSAVVVDAEDDGAFEKSIINQATIVKGINLIVNDGNFKINDGIRQRIMLANIQNYAGDIDATDADCIVQAGLFKDLIFG